MAVNPARTACTLSLVLQPDPETKRVMWLHFNGHVAQVLTINTDSYTRTATRGNIFATDR